MNSIEDDDAIVDDPMNVVQHFLPLDYTSIMGEDSVSLSTNTYMNYSRPTSSRCTAKVTFGGSNISTSLSVEEFADARLLAIIANRNTSGNNSKSKRPKIQRKKSKLKVKYASQNIINKYKSDINYNENNNNLPMHRILNSQNLQQFDKCNLLKRKLLNKNMKVCDVKKMSSDEMDEILIYINEIQRMIYDEKQRRMLCCLCQEFHNKRVIFLPCLHQRICINCANSQCFEQCPICRTTIEQIIVPK